MLSKEEMLAITSKETVIFYKPGCPYCRASQKLMEELKNLKKISDYSVYYLGEDFDNQTLAELAKDFGWEERFEGDVPTKPQIFINQNGKAQYIGGNKEFYKSDWNRVEGPNLENPMEG